MERRITDSQVLCAAALWLCLGGVAEAGTVRGTVQFPDEVKGGALRHGGYWRVPNGVLPVAPALHDVRAEAVVVLVPTGAATAAQSEAASEARRQRGRAEVRLAGLRLSPPVSVVAPGQAVTLQNEDRVPHTLVCPGDAAALPRQSIPAGGKVTLTLQKPGEYVLLSEEYAHLSGALIVIDRAYHGRVEASGAFQLEAPAGRYDARLFWRGAFVASEPVEVPEGAVEVRLKATLPGAGQAGEGKAAAGAGAKPAAEPS